MDTPAQHTERDRSSLPRTPEDTSDPRESEERSRSPYPGRAVPRLRGGRIVPVGLACLVFLLLVSTFVAQSFEIPSGSMRPGLSVGDRILVNKLAYRFGARPRRGDTVVFDGAGAYGEGDFVKRVVGTGGDHVVCCDREGRVEVNGMPVRESPFLYPGDAPSGVPFDVRVPDGTLFVLGDHRARSSDSRDRLGSPGGGMVPLADVIGRADWILWPAGHWSRLERPGAYARVPAADGGHG